MKIIASLLLINTLFSASMLASAADEAVLYKKVDKDGNVVFTDKPIPGSKEVKVKTDVNVVKRPKPTIKPDPEINQDEGTEDDEEKIYDVLAIDKPSNNQAVQLVGGKFTVIVGISPKLKSGHSLQLYLNGSDRGRPQSSAYFSVTDIGKGSYTLKIAVLDSQTEEIIQSSDSITVMAY